MSYLSALMSRRQNKRYYTHFPYQQGLNHSQKLIILLVISVTVSLAFSVFQYLKYEKLKNATGNPSVATEAEAKELQKKVSRLMVLPQEVPTIATISDYVQLKDQPFFNNSNDDDKLLIYSASKIAVLYRPKSDKIINVGPLTIEDKSAP